jgi:murein DD-endopeptidase MepM/ murein hydrolase activator NlpD
VAAATRAAAITAAAIAALFPASTAAAIGDSDFAALQVGLAQRGFYNGTIDGVFGAGTRSGLKRFQRWAGIAPNGIVSARTRAAFGSYAFWRLGSRSAGVGASGWDVAQLQFLLAWHGFPSGRFRGVFDTRVLAALRAFERWAKLPPSDTIEAETIAALEAPPPRSPLSLSPPLLLPTAGGFGPRHDRFHTGIDIPAASGAPVTAAGSGRVTQAGWLAGGWGYAVTIDHGRGLQSMYAHLSRVDVAVGTRVGAGMRIARVGATGDAVGPHLHFELRLRGAAIDPATALLRPQPNPARGI